MTSDSPSRAATTAEAGHEISGRYVLRRPVASGGMARVWEAEDTVLDRLVAVKVLHPNLANDPEFVERFRDEAKAAARLSHQSIVAIYDTASEDGIEAIVMELIDGITLRQYLDDFGPLPVEDATDLGIQVAEALGAAHAARLVHRDVKPGNILLCPDRRVKVTDFGIAKALEGGDRTTAGTLLGTAKYLAPEQVEGTPVDERADVYSLGVVLFEALTGRPPFDAETDSATALARLRVDPPLARSVNPAVPPALEQVVLQAMARDRNRRYPDALALADALRSLPDDPADAVAPSAATSTAGTPDAAAPDPTGPLAMPDPTTAGDVPIISGGGRAPTAPTTGSTPVATRRRRRASGVVVAALVAGCLALGLGLILITPAGRDFADRVIDAIRGDDEGTGVIESPDREPAGDAAAPEPDGAASVEDGDIPPANPDPNSVVRGPIIAEVLDFDPLGDGQERPDLVAFVADDDPTTMWTSEGYENRSLGNLKAGVGLVIVLEREATLTSLRVDSETEGWAASVYAADAPALELEAWGDPLDTRSGIGGAADFDLHKVRASAVLLWVTDLGDAPPKLRIAVAELDLS